MSIMSLKYINIIMLHTYDHGAHTKFFQVKTYERQQYVQTIVVILPLHIMQGWQTVRSNSFPSSFTPCSYIL